ncbi:MAG: hypothetical protein JWM28_3179, partial [Chitinophagaceae bacterium]|nr:hypothetical protein [Chitinophagaceae bacterium]
MKKPKMIYPFLFLVSAASCVPASAQEYRRWQMNSDNSITWNITDKLPHSDHIEMSGKKIAVVLRYTVNADSSFTATRSLVWPMLRTIPNNTHASLTRRFSLDGFELITINYKPVAAEKVKNISLNGILTVKSNTADGLELTRQYFPSTTAPGYCEIYTIRNSTNKTCVLEIPQVHNVYITDSLKGTEGSYWLHADVMNAGNFNLPANEALSFSIFYSGIKTNEMLPAVDLENEKINRLALVQDLWKNLVLETPDTVLNREFNFAKIRASESIYETKGGPMHSPGGESYYAAIWANDQAEYIGPFFPYLGYEYGNKASLNAYLHFARFMNDAYNPIPSSIIAEGLDIWNGAGDRGDAAMIAYGAARYSLTRGDIGEAQQLWPLIEWCLEYCKRKLNKEGVVNSDSDELEGRFPAGSANLNT